MLHLCCMTKVSATESLQVSDVPIFFFDIGFFTTPLAMELWIWCISVNYRRLYLICTGYAGGLSYCHVCADPSTTAQK